MNNPKQTYAVRLDDALIDEIIEIVCGWTGETGTDYMAVTVQVREALVRASGQRVTHGRHCLCSSCAAENWADPALAPCGMHGPSCPPAYDPWGRAGDLVEAR